MDMGGKSLGRATTSQGSAERTPSPYRYLSYFENTGIGEQEEALISFSDDDCGESLVKALFIPISSDTATKIKLFLGRRATSEVYHPAGGRWSIHQ